MTNDRPRILVLDDVETNRILLRDALADLAMLIEADSCARALELLHKQTFELLLLDIQLPDGRGDLLLQSIRQDHTARANATPAIAITGDADDAQRQALVSTGFVDVLVKPWQLSILRQVVKQHLPYATRSVGATISPSAVAEPDLDYRFDTPRALKTVGGNTALMQKMRAMFLAELAKQRANIAQARQQSDWSSIQEVVHQLAASSGFTGAHAIERAIHAYREQRASDQVASAMELLATMDAFLRRE